MGGKCGTSRAIFKRVRDPRSGLVWGGGGGGGGGAGGGSGGGGRRAGGVVRADYLAPSALISELSLPGSMPRPPLAAASAGLRAAGVSTGVNTG